MSIQMYLSNIWCDRMWNITNVHTDIQAEQSNTDISIHLSTGMCVAADVHVHCTVICFIFVVKNVNIDENILLHVLNCACACVLQH